MGREADAVLRLGLMMTAAGTGGYRVLRAMKRAARSLGFDRLDAIVSVNTITCTFHRGEMFRTVVANHHEPAVDASRIEALEDLSHHMHRRFTVEELNAELDTVERTVVKRWPRLLLSVAAGLACASFAVLNRYPVSEAAVVAVSAACGQFLRVSLGKRHFNQLGTVAAAGSVACLVYWAVAVALGMTGHTDTTSFAAGYVAAVLFLIPGFPLFSALLDLTRFDITAGISRLTYALSVIVTATISVGMVSLVTGLNPLPANPGPPSAVWWAAAAAASFVGVAGFALLFNCSRRMVLLGASLATVANMLRLVLVAHDVPQHLAAFIAGVVIGVIAAFIHRAARVPRITVTVPASVIMIPGVAMYTSMYALNTGDMDLALSAAASAALVVVSIAAGLALARMLTDPDWAYGRAIDLRKQLTDPIPDSAGGE
ncbi:threonine/serine ThrE exporter family protein [Corynebacterium pygosceleis]|uniref:Threonine/serine exporter family protein n=1 Tax=Corynebacterium pygosceleis TaxID=2800406 RepID=A0A9Q4C8Z8_9CORY|nr:threonine/serine exporter family protein [Corynebacterium pygosceleis]MCK7638427.1 threonine/serine exporter family protein [Corynebacterium pygosceleis]MCK7675407.1 threonine/serine exporter family protein [Corynebacterium pygosceleis]MCL0121199.1 threonine/serine exporter family protein [Corynebacterium pygosceleis]MCX7445413.1 threonine/serine exporter family protein [Corynebacterium pygosceleis]MCX7469091.1 threonine/serine exporter family protein [Corynebacterium pygosceleis]